MERKGLLLIAVSIGLIFQACKKDVPEPEMQPITSSDYQVDIKGSVIGPGGAFVSGALVEFNGQTATTDSRGVFRIEDVPAMEGRNYLEVHKQGYFFGGRNFYVFGPEEVAVKVQLVPKVLTGSFMASSGGTVATTEGLAVDIPSNAIENGYQGEVKVYAAYIDPSDMQSSFEIPGMEGVNANDEEGLLRSFGMGHIELEDNAGNKLQLASGVSAQLTVPVPSSFLATANTTIPLWYFDELEGIWKEEGSATLQGGVYVGGVSHFTFWNCDDFTCGIEYKISITCNGMPYADLPVSVKAGTGAFQPSSISGLTGSDGVLRTYLPCSETVEIYALSPGNAGIEYLIGTIQTQPGGTQVVTSSMAGICGPHTNVTGYAVDGNGQPVTNGYIYMEFDGFHTEPVFFNDQGAFDASMFYFGSNPVTDATITAWDLDNFIMAAGPAVPFNGQVNVLPSPIVIGGSVASVEGRIYTAGTELGMFYCLDASDGSIVWSIDDGAMEDEVSPVFLDGRVYFRNLSGIFSCVNAVDGSLIWDAFNSTGNSPMAADGVVYTSENGGSIRARDYNDGSILWSYSAGNGLYSSPTVVDDVLYCGTGDADPGLVALDVNDGSLLWQFDTPNEVNTSPCVADGKVFFADSDLEFYALDAGTGNTLWQATLGTGPYMWRSPTAGNGIVYAQSVNQLRAFDMNTGNELWMMNITSGSGGGDPYLKNGKLYVRGIGSAPGWFHCLDAQTGAVLWNIETTGTAAAEDYCVVVDGVLFIHRLQDPQTLEARDANNGQLIWTSPVADDIDAPMIVVDDFGEAHYTTTSGMQQ